MRFVRSCVLLGLAVGATAINGLGAEEPPPTSFPSGIEVVTVDAVVLDKSGQPVGDLPREAFRVLEDGKPQRISSFDAVVLPDLEAGPSWEVSAVSTNVTDAKAPAPRTFVIVFDNVHLTPLTEKRARQAVDAFLTSGLRPGDEVTIVPTAGGGWWSGQIPEDLEDLRAYASRLEGKRPLRNPLEMSDYEAYRVHVFRDQRVAAEVIRRYMEQGIVADYGGGTERMQYIKELDLGAQHERVRAEAMQIYNNAADRVEATLRALARIMDSLVDTRGRKAVLFLSEGFFHNPQIDGFRTVLDTARRANAVLYYLDARDPNTLTPQSDAGINQPIDSRDLTGFLDRWRGDAEGADTLAAGTGGLSWRNPNDLAGGMERVADESRAYYLLGYQSTNQKRDGKFRKIEVEVENPDFIVRARRGYYAPTKDGRVPTIGGELDPNVRRALDSPFGERALPLRLTAYVLGPTADGKGKVLVAAEADPGGLTLQRSGDRLVTHLDSYTLVTSRKTGENFHDERRLDLRLPPEVVEGLRRSWIPMFREFELVPGTYQVRFLLREDDSGKAGTVRHVFSVPAPDEFRVTTPILSDTLRPAAGGGAPQPVPLARRSFRSGTTLLCLFEILGAARDASGAAHVALGYGVRRVAGDVMASVDPQPLAPEPDGRYAPSIPISLAGVPAGQYQILLAVRDDVAGKTLELRERFDVSEPESREPLDVSE